MRPPIEQLPEQSAEPSPLPPQAGEGEGFDLRWKDFSDAWGFTDPTDLPVPAQRVFARLSVDQQTAAVGGARRYKTHCRVNDRKAKHARSWLNDRGWEAGAPVLAADVAANLVWVERGTQEAAAWNKYKIEVEGVRGLFMSEQPRPDGARAVGRYMPSKWPPPRSSAPAAESTQAAVAATTSRIHVQEATSA